MLIIVYNINGFNINNYYIHYYKNLFAHKCNCYAYDDYDSNATITFSFSASMPVERKHRLWITDYGLSCDTAGHHVTRILLGWL